MAIFGDLAEYPLLEVALTSLGEQYDLLTGTVTKYEDVSVVDELFAELENAMSSDSLWCCRSCFCYCEEFGLQPFCF